nr:UDP-N-acetylmuramate dehydrogenase [Saprospiraceae bacterium]
MEENYLLKGFNTFGLNSIAKGFVRVDTEAELQELPELLTKFNSYLILGGGSNVLLPDFFDGLVVHINMQKLHSRESGNEVLVNVGAGMNWHEFVKWTVDQNYGGIENLALIPGKTGAAPIQNIGAYGVEMKDVLVCLKAFHLDTGKFQVYNHEACEMKYRDSVFKNRLMGKVIIADMWIKLTHRDHQLNLTYGALKNYLEDKGIESPVIRDVFESVIEIRQSKLPDPAVIGNAGSFFKNPVVPCSKADLIMEKHPDLVFYPIDDQQVKIPAGWLIEQCGFKGKYNGQVGCFEKQALVLVNIGSAKAAELVAHAAEVQSAVYAEFGLMLEPEVNIIHPHLYGGKLNLSSVQ